MDVSAAESVDLVAARRAWTGAAYQEHRTAVACAISLRALIEARAPVDLIAVASRFPLDELIHVELCARMAMELGGGTEIMHDPSAMVLDVDPTASALMRAPECCRAAIAQIQCERMNFSSRGALLCLKSRRSKKALTTTAAAVALLGRAIRARRKALRLTQVDLSKLAGCGPDFVYDVESGKTSLRLDKLLDVLLVLGLELQLGDGKLGLRVGTELQERRT
jgi:y4mF family transcriptional regulator